jgi:ABC-type transport system involved in cytochrome c biogenesis ATPase subunit
VPGAAHLAARPGAGNRRLRGAGKTTLLRILGGLVAPDRGTVRLGGITLGERRRAYQRQIGLLTPGDRGLYARITVERHLDLGARLALMDPKECDPAVRYCSGRFALAELGGVRVDRLSMGQHQRVRLALTFPHAPRPMLLDEPVASLDSDALGLLRVDDARERGGMCLAVAVSLVDGLLSPRGERVAFFRRRALPSIHDLRLALREARRVGEHTLRIVRRYPLAVLRCRPSARRQGVWSDDRPR